MILTLLAILFGLAGTLAFYLSWPNQKLLAAPLSRQPGLFVSGAGVLASVVLLARETSVSTSIFIMLVIAMLVWTVMPFLMILKSRGDRENG